MVDLEIIARGASILGGCMAAVGAIFGFARLLMAATETKTSLKIGLDQVRIAEAEQTRALASLDKENSRAHHEITRELLEARSEARQGHAVLTERVDKIDTRVHAIEEDKK